MKTYKILIVDDMIENISVISSALESAEGDIYNLYQSANAETAFIIAEKRQPDLIITDWDMPGTNGIALIKNLKGNKNTKAIPVIMATGIMLSPTDLKEALEAGAVDYIRKPVDKIELLARVRSVLELDSYIQVLPQTGTQDPHIRSQSEAGIFPTLWWMNLSDAPTRHAPSRSP